MVKTTIVYLSLSVFCALIFYEIYVIMLANSNLDKVFSPYINSSFNDVGLDESRMTLLIKVQDPTFYSHSGIEWPSPLTTTTITQSLVKRLFFRKYEKGFSKLKQTLIARFVVNSKIDKNIQLIAFVSTAYFGNKEGAQIYGFNNGARAWFGKELDQLNDDEYISLLAMLPAPNRNKPKTRYSRERINRLKMVLSQKCQYTHVSQIQLEHCSPEN